MPLTLPPTVPGFGRSALRYPEISVPVITEIGKGAAPPGRVKESTGAFESEKSFKRLKIKLEAKTKIGRHFLSF